ncbi:LOW QUALITY PROTEIN: hypothetical protein TorRG33x02_158050 [Trema orientale]|uniref:Uncharacterized protein n=1 Tax=Trema orientale TaxID=63057 RepID=A0A2P5ESB2_TREOI|nr:LOW QUALITY PROTEIN: hypothetical protein TorRG33x02_158050 [Trema orientale]
MPPSQLTKPKLLLVFTPPTDVFFNFTAISTPFWYLTSLSETNQAQHIRSKWKV